MYNTRLLAEDETYAYTAVAGEMAGDFGGVEVAPHFLVETRPYHPSHYQGMLVYAWYEA